MNPAWSPRWRPAGGAARVAALCATLIAAGPVSAEEGSPQGSEKIPNVVLPFLPTLDRVPAQQAPVQPPVGAAAESPAPAPAPSPSATSDATGSAAVDPRVELHLGEGFAELRTRNAAAAAAAFEKVLEIYPQHLRARFGLATACIWLQDYQRARDMLEALARETPDDYAVKNNLAWLYATASDLRVRDGAKALAYGREAVLMAPQDFHVWSTLAEAYYVNEKYEQALKAAMEALRLAREAQLSADMLREYEQQVEKCRHAAFALSILE